MTRTGMSHARVVAWYMAWNLLVVLPVLWWINRMPAVQGETELWSTIKANIPACRCRVYLLAVALWTVLENAGARGM